MALAVSNTITTIFHIENLLELGSSGRLRRPFVRLLSEFSAEPFLSQPFIRGFQNVNAANHFGLAKSQAFAHL